MIEVFRFMDSSATSHPVYGIEHNGDAIDTAAIMYLGSSAYILTDPSDICVYKDNKVYHIGGYPEEKANNFHWYYNGKKYDFRATSLGQSGPKSIGKMKAGFYTLNSTYIYFAHDFSGLKSVLAEIYSNLGREYRVKIPIGLRIGSGEMTKGSTYVTRSNGINYQALSVRRTGSANYWLVTYVDWAIERNINGTWTHIGYIHIDPSQLPDPVTQTYDGLYGYGASGASGQLVEPVNGWWGGPASSYKTIKMAL
jgi:hypothetical protein